MQKYSAWKRNRQPGGRDFPGRGDAPELPELFRNRPSAPASAPMASRWPLSYAPARSTARSVRWPSWNAAPGSLSGSDSENRLGVKGIRQFAELAVRKADRNGQPLLIPEEELECRWTNLDCNAGACIRLYHAHGTREQFHAELKNDMRVERLPGGKLRSNSVMLSCAMLAFNCLRRLGELALRHDRARRATPGRLRKRARMRARTVIDTLLRVAGRVVSHAGRTVLKLGRNFRGFDRLLWIARRCCLQ